jgi:uncharacterized repeat protein (TIGR02543 family)
MELEELVIPRMIDGLEVEQLGWTTPLGVPNFTKHNFGDGKATKTFISPKIRFSICGEMITTPKNMIMDDRPFITLFSRGMYKAISNRLYVPAHTLKEYNDSSYLSRKFYAANVSYFSNRYPPSDKYYYYHWIDDIEIGETIKTIPPDPIRAGYAFGGWYTEYDCINEWDFNTPKTSEPINLFAKWIKDIGN